MARRSRALAQFALAFAVSLCVLAIPVSVALLHYAGQRLPDSASSEPYYPQTTDAITLLTAVRRQWGEAPSAFALLQIDPALGQILLAVIAPETMVEDAGRFDALSGVWRREGPARATQALSSALSVPIDRWLDMGAEGFIKLADTVGTVDYTLDAPLTLEDGTVVLTGGRQLFDGRRLSLLIFYSDYPGGETQRIKEIGSLLGEAAAQRVGLMSEAVAESVFRAAVNAGQSNLTVGDFESRRRAVAHMLSRDVSVRVIPVTGEYNAGENTFLPSAGALEELANAFLSG
jgi:anionic cell wall polymer biosynthesis LytR-Cps2A-Psr (LCP) family protein